MSHSDTLEAYFKWLQKKQPHLESYYKQLFGKYPWLKPAIPKPRKTKLKHHPLFFIRPKTLRILCFLVDKMSKEGVIVKKTDIAILMQLIMKWIDCSRRTAFDYAFALNQLGNRYCLL